MDLRQWAEKLLGKVKGFGIKEWGMVLAAGVCCLILALPMEKQEDEEAKTGKHILWSGEDTNNREQAGKSTTGNKADETYGDSTPAYVKELETRLSELLSCVENVGKVKVMITIESSGEKTVLQDGSREQEETKEQDSEGGSRIELSTKSDGTTVFSKSDGEESPYVLKEEYPKVSGVVVIAEGSGKGSVDLDILNAVQVLFDVPAHKIRIMKMK